MCPGVLDRARHAVRGLAVAGAIALVGAPLPAQIVVSVCFDCDGDLTDSYGRPVHVTATTLSATRRAYIIEHIQANYDDAVGAGVVKIVEADLSASYEIIVSGGVGPPATPPRFPKTEIGNAGAPGLPALVYSGQFSFWANFFGDKFLNAIAITAAHELGHKLGGEHNTNSPHDKMSETITNDELQSGTIRFNEDDKLTFTDLLTLSSAEPQPVDDPGSLQVRVGSSETGSSDPTDPIRVVDYTLDVTASFIGPLGAAFGFLTTSGEFAPLGSISQVGTFVDAMSFYFDGGIDMAVRVGGTVFDLLGGSGTVALSDPSPLTPGVFRTATLSFATTAGPSELTLRVSDATDTGGFVAAVPEPATVALVLGGLLLLGPARVRRARRRGVAATTVA